MLQTKMGRRIGAAIAGLCLLAFVAPVALGDSSAATPKLIGNAKAGKTVFSTTCAACHTLKAAGAVGTLGPNFDKIKPALAEAIIIKAVTNGGATVMPKAQLAKYTTQMAAYKGSLSATQINNVAAFVYTSTHPS
jgi:mono/diheme cytochrome c family protein